MAEQQSTQAESGSSMQEAVAAEQAARRAIEQAEAAAAGCVEQARADARLALNGVPARIARLRERGAHAVAKALAEIQSEEAAAMRALGESAFPADLVDRATAALVERLTGETPAAGKP